MNADSEHNDKSPEDGAEEAPVANESRWKRLKASFTTRYLRVIDALSGVLKRLRNLVGKPQEEGGEGEERGESRSSRKRAKTASSGEETPAALPPVTRSPVRSIFIYLLVLIVGAIAGMIFSFALLSNMVIRQAQKIEDQRDEITQLEKQHARVLESEAKYRNRLNEAETRLNQLNRRTDKETDSSESGKSPAVAEDKSAGPKKTANCSLEAGNSEKLARCLDEFNRKGGR